MRYKVCLEESHKAATIRDAGKYDVLAVDACYSAAEVQKIQAAGCGTVLCYVNYGMAEKDWPDFQKYKSICIAQNKDWKSEYWVNVTAAIWVDRIKDRVLAAKKKGFNGIWLDNGDIYWFVLEEQKNKQLAAKIYAAMQEMCSWIRRQGMILILNGADTFVSKLMENGAQSCISGINQETVYSMIKSYSGDGAFGKQSSEDHNYFKGYCIECKQRGLMVFLLEYTKDETLMEKIRVFCEAHADGFCISKSIKL